MRKLPLGEHNIDELASGVTIADVIGAASVTPFLSEKRMVIARGVLAQGGRGRGRARTSSRGGATPAPAGPAEQLAAYVPNLPETTHLVIVEDNLAAVAPLKAARSDAVERDFAPLRDDALPGWIIARAKKPHNTRINVRAANDLAQLVGS